MTNKEAIETLKPLTEYSVDKNGIGTFPMVSTPLQAEALDLAIKALEAQGWNPIKTEKISEAEKKEMAERYDMSPEAFDDFWRYACKMPEDNQECLITTSVWGYVVIDTFHIDEDGAMYFEDHEDEDEVLAWMPLPKPYTKEDDKDGNKAE